MTFSIKIKPTLVALALMFFYTIPFSWLSQDILKNGKNEFSSKDINYDRKIFGQKFKIKITPTINYLVDKNADYKESLEIQFSAEWTDSKNNIPKSLGNGRVFIINKPEDFIEICNKNKNINCKQSKIIDTETGEMKRTLELEPKNVIKYKPKEVYEPFVYSSKKIIATITSYNNDIIKMSVLFYLGTESESSRMVNDKAKLLTWEFQLPPDRPVCLAKLAYYQGRFDQDRPKQQLQSLKDKFEIGKDLYSLYDSIGEYNTALNRLEYLKDSIKIDINKFDCKELNQIVIKIESFLKTKYRAEELLDEIRQLRVFDKETVDNYYSNLKLFTENVASSQRLYRDLKKLQWDFKETQELDSLFISDKISIFNELNEMQDTIYKNIIESGKDD